MFFCCSIISVSGQTFRIKGIVIDKANNEPLPFCNIYAPQSKTGFSADENGVFDIVVEEKTDSLVFYYLGYENHVIKERKLLRNSDSLVVKMQSMVSELAEIVIQAPKKRVKDTLAIRIFRNVVANKPNNREQAFKTYQYEEYTKTVASYFNVSPKLVNRKIIRPFRFVFENQDTTPDGRRFIPLLLKETLVEHFKQEDPKIKKNIIKASKVSGIEQLRFSEVLDIVFDELDVYENQLTLSGKGFTLPFADGGLFTYKYFFIDSTENEKCEWVYKLAFTPRTKGDLAFNGFVWIHEPTYAIQKITLELDPRANINWYNDFSLTQEFKQIPDKGWVKNKESRTTSIAFTKGKKSKSIYLLQTKSRDSIRINQPLPDSTINHAGLYEKYYDKKDTTFWRIRRHDPLSIPENSVYGLIDSLKRTKAFKIYSKIGGMLSSGYYRLGPVDIGNIANTLSWNDVEGYRMRLQSRSNWKLSRKFRYFVYGAYGTGDKKFKYGAEFRYRIPNKNLFQNDIEIRYKDDYQRFSLENTNYEYDFVLNTFFRRRGFDDLVYIKDVNLAYTKQWVRDFTSEITLNWKQYQTIPGKIEFQKTQLDGSVTKFDRFNIFTPKLRFTITPGARFLQTENRNVYLKGNLPRIYIDYSFSVKDLLASDFNFQKLGLTVEQTYTSILGKTRYMLTATKLFGDIPYPMLFIHPGNENFIIDWRRFANMQEAEYGADEQISLLFEHHFEGFFLNKVPLLKKLKWREVFIAKMALSRLDRNKVSFTDLPDRFKGLDGFYAETGFGIENIFKLGKIQFTWRLTQKDLPSYEKFVIRFAVSPDF
jgi:hypothetical protein